VLKKFFTQLQSWQRPVCRIPDPGACQSACRLIHASTLDAAFLANPNRLKNKPPQLPPMPTAAWINPPPEEKNRPVNPSPVH